MNVCMRICECLWCVHKQLRHAGLWASSTCLMMMIHASCVIIYTCLSMCALLWVYVPVLYACMCVCLPSLHCEQQASWHLSKDGLAYQTTGTTPHVSWRLPLSCGVDYTRDIGIITGTEWGEMRVHREAQGVVPLKALRNNCSAQWN